MKCLIIDDVHKCLFDPLEEKGVQIDYKPKISSVEVESIIHNYEILVLRSKMKMTQEIISKAKNLKIIARAGAGLDNIDLEFAKKQGINVVGANEGNMDAVGEHTLALILALLNNIVKSNSEIKDFHWNREGNRGEELSEKIVGIIGYGFMGRAVAKRLKPFGCKIIAYDKYLKGFSDENVSEVSMNEIYCKTDILTLHIPLTEETNLLINSEYLDQFEKPIRFINAARGEIVCLEELILKIKDNKIIGAALDVLQNENIDSLSEDEIAVLKTLNAFDNVILTPHIAGWSVESYRKISEVLARNILRKI